MIGINSKDKKHFTATGVILFNNKILVKWHKKLKVWLPPGGHIEENETPEEALIREIKEEVDIDVKIFENKNYNLETDEVKLINNPYCILYEPILEHGNIHYHIDFIYCCFPILHNIKDIELEKKELKLISLDDVNTLDTFLNVKNLFFDIFKNFSNYGDIK